MSFQTVKKICQNLVIKKLFFILLILFNKINYFCVRDSISIRD